MRLGILGLFILLVCQFVSAQDCGDSYPCWHKVGEKAFYQKQWDKSLAAFKMAKNCKDLPANHDIQTWVVKINQQRALDIKNLPTPKSIENGNPTQVNVNTALDNAKQLYIKGEFLNAKEGFLSAQNAANTQIINDWVEKSMMGVSANDAFEKGNLLQANILYLKMKPSNEDVFIHQRLSDIQNVRNTWSVFYSDWIKHPSDTLDMSNRNLPGITDEIKLLAFVKMIDVSENYLQCLPNVLANFKNLVSINLSSNAFHQFPIILTQLTQLQSVDLSYNQLTILPSEVKLMSSLQELDLRHNQLVTLPTAIGGLGALERLYLNNNAIQDLPAQIGKLTKLKGLYLSGNQIRELPPEIGNMQALEELDVSENEYIKSIPESIGKCKMLKELDLGHNLFRDKLPSGLSKLVQLQRVSLRFCGLNQLSDSLNTLQNLKVLDLEGNRLSDLPPVLLTMTRLEELDLSANRLMRISPEINKMKNLKELNLRDNPLLTTLPMQIFELQNLETLDIRNTRIPKQEIANLRKFLPPNCELYVD